MDFFEAQDMALRKTRRLVIYYLLAVVVIVGAVYAAVTAGYLIHALLTQPEAARSPYGGPAAVALWEPMRFLLTASGVVALVGLGTLYKTLSLRGGGSSVAKALGGERVDRSTRDGRRKQLLNVVEEMAIAAGIPVPEVYLLMDEEAINAFAAGWGQDDAVIAVSEGALRYLSRDELQGVVAHEYSHILHGDCRLNIRLMGVLFGILMLSIFGQVLRVAVGFGGGHRARRRVHGGGGGGRGGGGALIIAVLVVVLLVTLIGYIGTFFGRMIQAAISRQREFLADAAAVQFTRNPEGIGGALKKLGSGVDRGQLNHPNAGEAAHMYFADGLKRSFGSALATHPPLEERIRQIEPGWDGTFAMPEPEQRPQAGGGAAKGGASPPRSGASGGSMGMEGMAIMGAIGSMSQQNLDNAQAITARIPEALDDRLRDADGAKAAVLALLLADNSRDDEAQLAMLKEALPAAEVEAVREIHALLVQHPRQVRLAVLELATSTLAQSGKADTDSIQELLEKLIHADDHLSLYEFCVRRILAERLRRGRKGEAGAPAVRYTKGKPPVADAVGKVLSIVARRAAEAEDPQSMVERALEPLGLLQGKVRYQSAAEAPLRELDDALDLLRTCSFALRAQCLRGVVFCLKTDGRLSPEEAEVLRMLGLGLDCPVPPLAMERV